MGGFNFGGGSQQVAQNSVENIDSPNNIQARKEGKEKEREKLLGDFKERAEYLPIKNTLGEQGLRKNKINEILNKLLYKFEVNPNNFNFIDGLDKVINGEKRMIGVSKVNLEGVIENNALFLIVKKALTQAPEKKTDGFMGDSAQKDVLNDIGEAIGVGSSNEGGDILGNLDNQERQQEEEPRSKNNLYGEIIGDVSEKSDMILDMKTPKSQVENEKFTLLKNSPYFPILKDLRNNSQITQETFAETVESLTKASVGDEKRIVSTALISISDKKFRSEIYGFINGKEDFTQENFEKSPLSMDVQSLGIDFKHVGNLETSLANNYFSIPNKSNASDKKQDFARSIDITLNNIIKGNDKDFRKDNAKTISKIRGSSNLQYKYTQLQLLHKKDLQNDAKYFKKIDKQRLIKEKSKITQEFNERKELLIQQGEKHLGKDKKLGELDQRLQEITTQLGKEKQPKQGDANMGGGEVDVPKSGEPELSRQS